LVFEKNKDEEGRREAYKNLDSEQYLSNTFTDKLLALTLSNLAVLIRTHVTHSQSLNLPKARPWAALKNDGKVIVAFCDCIADLQGTYNHNVIFVYIQNVIKIIIVIKLSSLQIHRLGGVCIPSRCLQFKNRFLTGLLDGFSVKNRFNVPARNPHFRDLLPLKKP
jgi:hypothetical protein